VGFFDRLAGNEPIESAEIAAQRRRGDALVDERTHMRKVTVYAAGHNVGMWFPGTDLWEVNKVVKAWIEVGDDDDGPGEEFSSRIVEIEGREVLLSFRRSWVAGYHIPLRSGEARG